MASYIIFGQKSRVTLDANRRNEKRRREKNQTQKTQKESEKKMISIPI
jgi:hypothetical protein